MRYFREILGISRRDPDGFEISPKQSNFILVVNENQVIEIPEVMERTGNRFEVKGWVVSKWKWRESWSEVPKGKGAHQSAKKKNRPPQSLVLSWFFRGLTREFSRRGTSHVSWKYPELLGVERFFLSEFMIWFPAADFGVRPCESFVLNLNPRFVNRRRDSLPESYEK